MKSCRSAPAVLAASQTQAVARKRQTGLEKGGRAGTHVVAALAPAHAAVALTRGSRGAGSDLAVGTHADGGGYGADWNVWRGAGFGAGRASLQRARGAGDIHGHGRRRDGATGALQRPGSGGSARNGSTGREKGSGATVAGGGCSSPGSGWAVGDSRSKVGRVGASGVGRVST